MTTRVSQEAQAKTGRDAGFSLMELIVSMSIFLIILAVFVAGMVTMTRNTVRAQDVGDSGDAIRLAFQNMDKQIRYASSINFPGPGASGAVYVEFITTAQPDGQAPLCTQWRYDPNDSTLAYRTWRDVVSGTASNWRIVATDIVNELSGPDAQLPFSLQAVNGPYLRQQLTVALQAGTYDDVTADTTTVFVARNSSGSSPSNNDLNGDLQSDTPICTSHLERP